MSSIADEKYVSFTTFRRNGKRVSSPVWIADLSDDTAGFTTAGDSGKVKRLRVDSQVELAASDVRGNVKVGAVTHIGTAAVVDGADFQSIKAAILDKYGIQFRLINLSAKLRRRASTTVGIVVTLDGTA